MRGLLGAALEEFRVGRGEGAPSEKKREVARLQGRK